MKKLFTLLLVFALAFTSWAQNCGTVTFPGQLELTQCATDDRSFIIESSPNSHTFELFGEGITIEQSASSGITAYYFDPSAVHLEGESQKTVELQYGTYDDCQNWVTVSQFITVGECDCGTVTFPGNLDDDQCTNDDCTVLIETNGFNQNFQLTGEGITVEQGPSGFIYSFCPGQVDMAGVGTKTLTLTYVAKDDCNVDQTVTKYVVVRECGCEPTESELRVPQSICNDAGLLFIALGNSPDHAHEIYGPGIVFQQGEYFFDPSLVNPDQSTTFNHLYDDRCGTWVTEPITIYVENCTVSGLNSNSNFPNMTLAPNIIRHSENSVVTINNSQTLSVDIHSSIGVDYGSRDVVNNQFDVSTLKSGQYIITAHMNNGDAIPFKLVVE